MKSVVKSVGVVATVVAIVFLFASCEGGDSLNGTVWIANDGVVEFVLKFNAPNFTLSALGETVEGSYSVSGVTVSIAGRKDARGIPFAGTGTLAGVFLTLVDNNDNSLMFEKRQ